MKMPLPLFVLSVAGGISEQDGCAPELTEIFSENKLFPSLLTTPVSRRPSRESSVVLDHRQTQMRVVGPWRMYLLPSHG